MMRYRRALVALSIPFALSACSTAMLQPIQEKVDTYVAEADAASQSLKAGQAVANLPQRLVKRMDGVWLPVSRVEETMPPAVAAIMGREVGVNRRFASIVEVAAYVTQLVGAPTSVAPLLVRDAEAQQVSAAAMQQASAAANPAAQLQGMNTGLPGATSFQQKPQNSPLVYSGKLSGFLDLAASRYGAYWEWDGRSIHFFRSKSRTYRLAALPGDTSLTSRIGSQSSTATGGTGTSTSGTSNSELRAGVEFAGMSVWKGIEDSIRTMMTADGKLTVTPSTGTITLDDTPLVLERVGTFVENQNLALSRQVVLNVRVLAVELNHSHAYGINWNLVYQNLGRSVGVTASSAGAPVVGGGSLAFRILSGSMWDGSSAIVDALSKQGKVSQVTSASMVTINNQPAPIQVGRQTAYLASSTTTLSDSGTPTVTLQPGQINTGFSMNMLPHILDGNRLMLQYSGDISTLTRLNTVTSGESSIQTPEVDTRNFMQRTIMASGETLVVTGFEQFNLNAESSGVGRADNVAFGGGVNGKNSRNVLVVLIQPVLLGSKS